MCVPARATANMSYFNTNTLLAQLHSVLVVLLEDFADVNVLVICLTSINGLTVCHP